MDSLPCLFILLILLIYWLCFRPTEAFTKKSNKNMVNQLLWSDMSRGLNKSYHDKGGYDSTMYTLQSMEKSNASNIKTDNRSYN